MKDQGFKTYLSPAVLAAVLDLCEERLVRAEVLNQSRGFFAARAFMVPQRLEELPSSWLRNLPESPRCGLPRSPLVQVLGRDINGPMAPWADDSEGLCNRAWRLGNHLCGPIFFRPMAVVKRRKFEVAAQYLGGPATRRSYASPSSDQKGAGSTPFRPAMANGWCSSVADHSSFLAT